MLPRKQIQYYQNFMYAEGNTMSITVYPMSTYNIERNLALLHQNMSSNEIRKKMVLHLQKICRYLNYIIIGLKLKHQLQLESENGVPSDDKKGLSSILKYLSKVNLLFSMLTSKLTHMQFHCSYHCPGNWGILK